MGDRVEVLIGEFERFGGDVESRHAAALQGHQLPADDAQVGVLAGEVPPSAGVALSGDDEVDRPLRGAAKRLVARQGEGVAQHDARDSVGVHARMLRSASPQVSVGFLLGPQPAQSFGDVVLVVSDDRRLAGAEERHQGQRRIGRIEAGVAVGPATVALLLRAQPAQARAKRPLRSASCRPPAVRPRPAVADRATASERRAGSSELASCLTWSSAGMLGVGTSGSICNCRAS